MKSCPIRAQCPGEVAVIGIDAQTPDVLEYLSFVNDGKLPRLGCDFGDIGLPGWGSATSPDYADIAANNNQLQNEVNGHIQPAAMSGVPTPPRPESIPRVPSAVIRLPGFPRQIDPGVAPIGIFCGGNTLADQPAILNSPEATCVKTCPDGTTQIVTLDSGAIQSLNQSDADAIAKEVACQLAANQLLCITPETLPAICLLQPFTQDIVVTSNSPYPLKITLAGTLPTGMEFNQVTPNLARIDGLPTKNGTFNLALTVEAVGGPSRTINYTLIVFGVDSTITGAGTVELLTPNLPDAYLNNQYAFPLDAPAGVQLWVSGQIHGEYHYALVSGSLPPGLSLDPTGLITGIPTAAGIYPFFLQIINGPVSCVQEFVIETQVCNFIDVTQLPWSIASQSYTGDGAASVVVAGEQGMFSASCSTAGSANNAYVSSAVQVLEADFNNHCPTNKTVHFAVTINGSASTVGGSTAGATLLLKQNGVIVFSTGGILTGSFAFDLVFNPGHTTLDWQLAANANGTSVLAASVSVNGTIAITN